MSLALSAKDVLQALKIDDAHRHLIGVTLGVILASVLLQKM